ncbi:MAG TPA: M56 family metallopeptidase [Luteibacter sp.]|nr:M56 family metallopeptidase [Luteibacter sp.]
MDRLNDIAGVLGAHMAWTSLQAVLLIATVAVLTRLMPRLSAAARSSLWWLVGLQLIVGLAWAFPIQMRLESPTATTVIAAATTEPVATGPSTAAVSWISGLSWITVLVTLWLGVVAVQCGFALIQWRRIRRVLRDSRALDDPLQLARCADMAHRFGLRRPPALRVADGIVSPHVVGPWRPTVLLPPAGTLTPADLDMALRHELAHLRRGDLWLGWVPALAQRLFFFHPLVHWAVREYAVSREEACDARVLRDSDTTADNYGRLLLRLGVQPAVRGSLATASPTFRNLKRRLSMLPKHANEPRQHAVGWMVVVAIALAGVVPYRVTASSTPPPLPETMSFSYTYAKPTTDAYTFFDPTMVMSDGSAEDDKAARLVRKGHESLLWVRHGKSVYAIRDPATMTTMRKLFAPMFAIYGQHAMQEGQLKLTSRQLELSRNEAKLRAAQDTIAEHEAKLTSGEEKNGPDAGIARLQADLATQARDLDAQQAVLERDRAAYEKQQSVYSEELRKAFGDITRQVATVSNQAITANLAERLP